MTVSPASLDTIPSPATAGNTIPAASTPAAQAQPEQQGDGSRESTAGPVTTRERTGARSRGSNFPRLRVNRGALDFVCAVREHFLSTDQERVMDSRWNWRSASRCRTSDAEDLFVTGRKQREARSFCRVCPVRTECLAHALDQRIEFGVWGGMTERERRALLRRRPDVRSLGRALGRRPRRARRHAARHGRAATAPARHERLRSAASWPRCWGRCACAGRRSSCGECGVEATTRLRRPRCGRHARRAAPEPLARPPPGVHGHPPAARRGVTTDAERPRLAEIAPNRRSPAGDGGRRQLAGSRAPARRSRRPSARRAGGRGRGRRRGGRRSRAGRRGRRRPAPPAPG